MLISRNYYGLLTICKLRYSHSTSTHTPVYSYYSNENDDKQLLDACLEDIQQIYTNSVTATPPTSTRQFTYSYYNNENDMEFIAI